MSIASLANVLRTLAGAEPSPEERTQLVKEALLMTLARASSADSAIAPVEVSSVRRVIKEATGETVSEAEVRVAAGSEIFETTPLESALSKLGHRLESKDRALIAQSLASIIKSDCHVSDQEVDFFDRVAQALKLKPSELVGLVAGR